MLSLIYAAGSGGGSSTPTTYTSGGNDGTGGFGANTYVGLDDVVIKSFAPDTNYSPYDSTGNSGGTITTDSYGDLLEVLLHLPAIPAGGSGIAVSSARLFYLLSSEGDTSGGTSTALGINFNLYSLKRAWTESAVTYNDYDGTNAWASAGAHDTTADRDATPVAQANSWVQGSGGNTDGSNYAFISQNHMSWSGAGLAQWVQDIRNGVRVNNGLLLEMASANNNAFIAVATKPYVTDGGRAYIQWTETSGGTSPTNYTASLTESGTAADAPSASAGAVGYTSSLSEAGTGADTESGSTSTAAAISESGTAADTSSSSSVKASSISESGAAADAPSAGSAITGAQTESGAASDAPSSIAAPTAAITEAGTAADTSSPGAVSPTASTTESGSAADTTALVGAGMFASSDSEAGAASDTSSLAAFTPSANVTESGAAADTSALVGAGMFVGSEPESGAALDTSAGAMAASQARSESGAAADTVAGMVPTVVSIGESGTAADTDTAALGGLAASDAEAGAASDASSGSPAYLPSIAESGAATDAPSGSTAASPALTESGSAADTSSLIGAGQYSVSETEAGNGVEMIAGTINAPVTVPEAGAALDVSNSSQAQSSSRTEAGNAVDAVAIVPAQNYPGVSTESGAAAETEAILLNYNTVEMEGGSAAEQNFAQQLQERVVFEQMGEPTQVQNAAKGGVSGAIGYDDAVDAEDVEFVSIAADAQSVAEPMNAQDSSQPMSYSYFVNETDAGAALDTSSGVTALNISVVSLETGNAVDVEDGMHISGAAQDLESLFVSDSFSTAARTLTAALAESGAAVEATDRMIALTGAILDVLHAVDTDSITTAFLAQLGEVLAAFPTQATVAMLVAVQAEHGLAQDAQALGGRAVFSTIAEAGAAADAQSQIPSFTPRMQEVLSLLDAISMSGSKVCGVIEAGNAVVIVAAVAGKPVMDVESMNAVDTIAGYNQAHFFPVVYEPSRIGDMQTPTTMLIAQALDIAMILDGCGLDDVSGFYFNQEAWTVEYRNNVWYRKLGNSHAADS